MKRFRGLLIMVTVFAFLFSSVPAYAAAQATIQVINDGQNISVSINGSTVNFEQAPRISGGRTLVQFRAVAEALGWKVYWDAGSMKVTITGDKVIELVIGSSTAVVDGQPVAIDAPAVVINGRTMVPLRFVSEALGAKVEYSAPPRPVQTGVSYAPPAAPWEFHEIGKLMGGMYIDKGGLHNDGRYYQIDYAKEVNLFIFQIFTLDAKNGAEVEKILQVFFPTGYERAYGMVAEAWDTGEKTDWTGDYDKKKVLDGRSFECQLGFGKVIIDIQPAK